MGGVMKVDYPGYFTERMPSGNIRHRCREAGRKNRKHTLPCGPDHPDFFRHYDAARRGGKPVGPQPTTGSIAALARTYLDHLEAMVKAGGASPLTLRQRRSLLTRLCAVPDDEGDTMGDYDIQAPQSAFVLVRDTMLDRPAEADNMMKAARAMYRFGIERDMVSVNPIVGIGNIHRSRGGAVPWTAADLRQYREEHTPGSTAHLYLTLLLFTGCRISDAIWLGRDQEFQHQGQAWLGWQPRKRGSAYVEMPMLPPLHRATRAAPVIGPAYILSEKGKPFTTPEALRVRFRRWCDKAGLDGRSSHGVRKGFASLLAEEGIDQHAIMSVMSHTKASTSEIYTKGAQRRVMAANAMSALRGMDW